jgi:DnaJ-class molecular chaperone
MTYGELQQALRILDLGERASLKEIKARHRRLVKRHHPDLGEPDARQIRRINAAYRLLLDYCNGYRFCFNREEFFEQNPEERLREQFMPYGMGEEKG